MTHIPDIFAQLESAKEWVEFFNNLIEEQVQWMFEWFPTDEFIIRSRDAPYLVLIGLTGIYPYVPIRVMRQAGRKQVVARVVKMSHFRADFQDDDVSYKCQAQHMWHCKIIVEKNTIEL